MNRFRFACFAPLFVAVSACMPTVAPPAPVPEPTAQAPLPAPAPIAEDPLKIWPIEEAMATGAPLRTIPVVQCRLLGYTFGSHRQRLQTLAKNEKPTEDTKAAHWRKTAELLRVSVTPIASAPLHEPKLIALRDEYVAVTTQLAAIFDAAAAARDTKNQAATNQANKDRERIAKHEGAILKGVQTHCSAYQVTKSGMADARKKCAEGDLGSCSIVGSVLLLKAEVSKESAEKKQAYRTDALKVFDTACAKGEAFSCVGAAARYDGKVDKESQAALARLAGKGCRLGNVDGCGLLAKAYYDGVAVKEDKPAAVAAWEKSCALGNDTGCLLLGMHHMQSPKGPGDRKYAFQTIAQACSWGLPNSCTFLRRVNAKASAPKKPLETPSPAP